MMLEDFSGGYYRSQMVVQQYDGGPAINTDLYQFIKQELFADDAPVMIRLGLDAGQLFDVAKEAAIPRDVLALPRDFFESTGETDVFVLKPEYVDTVGKYYG